VPPKLREIAEAMEARGIRTPSGGTRWHAATVAYVMKMAGVAGKAAKRLPPLLVPNPGERQWWTGTGGGG
jgi:hypothetical protein